MILSSLKRDLNFVNSNTTSPPLRILKIAFFVLCRVGCSLIEFKGRTFSFDFICGTIALIGVDVEVCANCGLELHRKGDCVL